MPSFKTTTLNPGDTAQRKEWKSNEAHQNLTNSMGTWNHCLFWRFCSFQFNKSTIFSHKFIGSIKYILKIWYHGMCLDVETDGSLELVELQASPTWQAPGQKKFCWTWVIVLPRYVYSILMWLYTVCFAVVPEVEKGKGKFWEIGEYQVKFSQKKFDIQSHGNYS